MRLHCGIHPESFGSDQVYGNQVRSAVDDHQTSDLGAGHERLCFATHRVVYIVLGNIMDSINKANALATLLAILVGVLVYFVMLLKTRTITSEELKLLPKEDKWIRLFDRFKK